MTREEAIRILASSCIPGSKQTEALETLIPELRESEDERMLRLITEGFKNYSRSASKWNNCPVDEIIAWLEKQKPAEWSDTDNIGWDEAFACVTRAEKSAKNEEELQNAVTAEKWLKEIKFKYYVHPIKQEWSEEEYGRLFDIEHYLDGTLQLSPDRRIACIDFLKSLRPQKLDASKLENFDPVDVLKRIKKEWPMAWSIFLLSNNDLNDGCPGITGDPDPAGVWKPSEEQMDALEIIVQYGDKESTSIKNITSLYEQLKKLGVKEEPEYYQHFDPDC